MARISDVSGVGSFVIVSGSGICTTCEEFLSTYNFAQYSFDLFITCCFSAVILPSSAFIILTFGLTILVRLRLQTTFWHFLLWLVVRALRIDY